MQEVRQHVLELMSSLQRASVPSIDIFYSMCCKCQVFTNVTRMQTQSMLIFSYGKCSIKQATDNGNYVAHE